MTAAKAPKIFWLPNGCPPWCMGGHRIEDHPDDRVHYGTAGERVLLFETATEYGKGDYQPRRLEVTLRQHVLEAELQVQLNLDENSPLVTLTMTEARDLGDILRGIGSVAS